MQVIPYFKYLSCYKYDINIENEIFDSSRLNYLFKMFHELRKKYDNDEYEKNKFINSDKSIYKFLQFMKQYIEKKFIDIFNFDPYRKYYIWIDDITTIRLTKNSIKILVIDGKESSMDIKEMRKLISEYMELLDAIGEGYDENTFDDIIYLVGLDIIPRYSPICIIYPNDIDDYLN